MLRDAPRSEAGRRDVTTAAHEYRELLAESPESLRTITTALLRVGARRDALDTLDTLAQRGQATEADRRRAIELALQLADEHELVIDDGLYRTSLEWAEKDAKQPSCRKRMVVVRWTEGHQEHAHALERALDVCFDNPVRAQLLTALFRGEQRVEDACRAVAHGALGLAEACARWQVHDWRVTFARAVSGQESLERLRLLAVAPDATSFALQQAAQAAKNKQEACDLLARAEAIDLAAAEKDDTMVREAVLGQFTALRARHSCN